MQFFKGPRILSVSLTIVLFGGKAFAQSCPQPNYPTATPAPIDATSCGPAGKGGTETAQNEAKNNFCATGPVKPITIAEMVDLQAKVQEDKSIPFGNADSHPLTSTPGPATDRSPLKALGEGSQVVLTGFVKMARQEGAESVNCGTEPIVPNRPQYHDIHIAIVADTTQGECSGVVVEMIPHHRPAQWTPMLVSAVAAANSPVRITGQLMFDSSHTPCISGQPVRNDPSRASLWEVHPIYKFEVCTQGDCSSGTGWVVLEQWKRSGGAGRPSPTKKRTPA